MDICDWRATRHCIRVLLPLCLFPSLLLAQPGVKYRDGVFYIDGGEPTGVAFTGGSPSYLVAALSFEGLVVLAADGRVVDRLPFEDRLSEATSVAVSDRFPVSGDPTLLVVIADEPKSRVVLRGLDPDSGRFLGTAGFESAGTHTVAPLPRHVCFARDPVDDSLYLFTGGVHGELVQYRVVTRANGLVGLKHVRSTPIGGEIAGCAADNHNGTVYVVEDGMALWQLEVDAEIGPARQAFSFRQPYGELGDPGGVFLLEYDGRPLPVVVDGDRDALLRLSPEGTVSLQQGFVGTFLRPPANDSPDAVAAGRSGPDSRDTLALAVTDGNGGGEIHLVPAGALGGIPEPARPPAGQDAVVRTRAVSEDVFAVIDAGDDPAIWVHPTDSSRSLVLGADKKNGLGVYDLSGNLVQFLPGSRLNNIDLRPGFMKTGPLSTIAAATDRTRSAIALFGIDPETGRVSRVEARTIPVEFYDPYGLCMYRSRQTDDLYVIATNNHGLMHQWRLFPDGGGNVDAELVRRITIGSVAEGCVADDQAGWLYVAEERRGVWRYGAEPDSGDDRSMVARLKSDGGELTPDLEGLAIYDTGNGRGYLIATSQGAHDYSVYDRTPPYRYRGTFRIRANLERGLDGTALTDGIDVTSASLPGYPHGLLVAQDGRYDEDQNFKYVSWGDIARALSLRQ